MGAGTGNLIPRNSVTGTVTKTRVIIAKIEVIIAAYHSIKISMKIAINLRAAQFTSDLYKNWDTVSRNPSSKQFKVRLP